MDSCDFAWVPEHVIDGCCAISNRTIQNAARPGIISAANIDLFDNQFEIPTALVTPTPPTSQSTRTARITSKRPPINSRFGPASGRRTRTTAGAWDPGQRWRLPESCWPTSPEDNSSPPTASRCSAGLGKGLLGVHEFLLMMADTLTETTHWGSLKTDVAGYVGIDTLQEQIRKKVLRRGFEFNIVVVGRSGLGKSTLINTLFKANISRRTSSKKGQEASEPAPYVVPKTTEVKSISHVIEEKGTRLRLTVTDTPGFGDQVNNENCWLPILEYINEQYEKYLSEEQSVTRKKHIPDTRVHCCLYFVPPSGHSLTPLDVEFMKRLDKCVNIVPVIAKADTLTIEERNNFKQKIREDLARNGICVYPVQEFEDDPEETILNNKIRAAIPFAVVGSDKQHTVNGRTVFGRQTQWGLVEVENRMHCEFPDLRDMLIRTHMQDLVEVTKTVHYENFRHERLQARNGHLNGQAINIVNLNESSL